MTDKKLKIIYITPSLYIAGGVERVLTLKANYFAEHFGYDITVILTDGKGKPFAFPLSDKIKVINLDVNFEVLWTCSFVKKIFVYLLKQHQFKHRLALELKKLHADITISLLRREINFINKINDGSKKIGELHVNRANYRNFEANETNFIKRVFEKFWMRSLVGHLKNLDRFVVLTHEDRKAWTEIPRVDVIPDPLSFQPKSVSPLTEKRVIAVGRYVYQKGFDLLLQAWKKVELDFPEWELVVYGAGNREPYEQLAENLSLKRCYLNGSTTDIESAYIRSSVFVFSSRFEGFGMVLVEAMACGLPVVSSDCPCGPKDIVHDGVDGYLFHNGNSDDLACKLSFLMGNNDLIQSMSQAALQNVERFRMEHIAEQWRTLFHDVVNEI